ncbi:MAG: transcription elongation factor GreA [Parcubacteria group bacterium]|nr:transcription elongation factor GreA [Parcubacteria group bacterium]
MPEKFTKQGLEKLKKELEYLKTTKTREIAKRINYAASFGDLSENAAYSQAKEDRAFCVGRIMELEKALTNARVIESTDTGKVQIGSLVTVESSGEKDTLQIVGEKEANIMENKISYKSPLGLYLCGKSAGDTAKIETPAGDKLIYKILKVE